MNREIKFRAWTSGEMVDVGKMEFFTDGQIILNDEFPVNPKYLMQCTGLKDKNGKEVWEGDIVKKEDPSYWHKKIGDDEPEEPDAEDLMFYRGGTAQVIYGNFGFFMQDIDCGEWCFNGPEGREWSSHEIEVIGNIYEHPHLLKAD